MQWLQDRSSLTQEQRISKQCSSNISGFAINWERSAILFKGNGYGELREVHSPQIKVVDSFKYLGVIVHHDISRYLEEEFGSFVE